MYPIVSLLDKSGASAGITNYILIYLLVLAIPLYIIRFSIFGLKTNVLDVLLVIFIVWQFIKLGYKPGLLRSTRNNNKYILPIFLILIGAIIATTNSSDISRSLGILKSYFILPILFFFTTSSVIKTQGQKEKVLKVLFLSGFIVALISIFYWITGDLTYDGRLRGFFESPNQLAMFLAPAFIIGIYIVQTQSAERKAQNNNSKLKIKKFLYFVAALLIGAIIFATKSLGAIIALFIALLPFFYRQLTNRRGKYLILFITSLLIVGCWPLIADKDFSERSSLASRVMIWRSAGTILKDNLVWGIGPGTFQKNYLEYQKYFPPYLDSAVPHPHNIFLAFWLQTGIIGFIGFLWLIFIFFKNVRQNKNDNIVFLSRILMIYTLAYGLIDTTYWRNDLSVIFWVIILLSQSLEPAKSSARQD